MSYSLVQDVLSVASGGVVGFSLAFVGGGGSILAIPLMIYLVKVPDPHVAIGTSAWAVSANAAANLINHARGGRVKWPSAMVFAVPGMLGALAGSTLGKAIDGRRLLFLFALVMVAVGAMMLRSRHADGDETASLNGRNAPKLVALGGVTGALSGFFGIGGGFLIVPSLMAATGMPILYAVGSSLLAVTALGLTTGLNYAVSGWVDWRLAGLFVVGGVLGGLFGANLANAISGRRGMLSTAFAGLIFVVAAYMLAQSFPSLAARSPFEAPRGTSSRLPTPQLLNPSEHSKRRAGAEH
jgi:uncharacterized membrane protein YfcA